MLSEDLSVLCTSSCALHVLRSLCKLEILCPFLNEKRANKTCEDANTILYKCSTCTLRQCKDEAKFMQVGVEQEVQMLCQFSLELDRVGSNSAA